MIQNESLRNGINNGTLRLKSAVSLVWQCAPGWTVTHLMLLALQGALPLLSLYLMKLVVDRVTSSLVVADKVIAFRQIAILIGIMGVVTLFSALCRSIAGLVRETQAQIVTDHVFDILHSKSIMVDLECYENPKYYDTLHLAQQEAPYRPTRIVNGLAQVSQCGISLLLMTWLLFSFHWSVAVILIVAAIPGALVRLKYSGKLFSWQRKRTPTERQASYFNCLLTRDIHAKEIRLFGLGALFLRRFHDLRQQLRLERLEIVSKRSIAELVTQISTTLAVFSSYAFIAYRTVQGVITLGDLVMYYQAFQRGQGFLQEMLSSLAGLYEDNLFLSDLFIFLDLKPKVLEPHRPKSVPKLIQAGIVFDHVSFQYPTGSSEVLKDISLTIRPGEHVALVGENGAGKTSLIKLLCRLYDPSEGVITLDGLDLRQFLTSELRREISVIFQDYARYNLTARENIWFGDITSPLDSERITTAARHSGIDDVITTLPLGYDTTLGKWFEDGEELSIGEWQKVALARACLRDSGIIVLDEPTSSLDPKSEDEFLEKFRSLAEGKMAVIISHRLSTVTLADCIYFLKDGRIVESGTHRELMGLGGEYFQLFEVQAKHYR